MMAFITHCWKSARLEALLLLACACAALWPAVAAAQERAGSLRVMEASAHVRDSAIVLNGNLTLNLPEAVEDALRKGIPLIFVAQARVMEPRWYWRDRVVSTAQRYYRLSYQPLTGRWRLSISAELPQLASGLAFGQNLESLDAALGVLRRFTDWRIATLAEVGPDHIYTIEFSFQLDVSQLPRPLQIGMGGQSDWRFGAEVDFQWQAPAHGDAAADADRGGPSQAPGPGPQA